MKEIEEAIYNWHKFRDGDVDRDALEEHKQTCERWLEWILEKHKEDNIHDYQDKLQDLNETIKFYEERGIE